MELKVTPGAKRKGFELMDGDMVNQNYLHNLPSNLFDSRIWATLFGKYIKQGIILDKHLKSAQNIKLEGNLLTTSST